MISPAPQARTLVGETLCSGIGAPEVAAPWIDWRVAAEIEPFPRAVLQQRHGYTPAAEANQGDRVLFGDFTAIDPELLRRHGAPLPDLIVAGTPCQAFSLAGLRRGIADDRGNLTLQFVKHVHKIREARPDGALTVVWENVPGVLSDKANAFGGFLSGLVGADAAFATPDGKGWPEFGLASGPRGCVSWRVFDAQHFRLAQRRRRVFLVADFGGRADPVSVLFERAGGPGSFAPGRNGRDPFERAPIPDAREARRRGGARHQWPARITGTLDTAFSSKLGLENQHLANGAGFFVPGVLDGIPGIRRLTPRECERLQGFPDDFTAIEWRGRAPGECPAGPRYKALGNSIAVPVMTWILARVTRARAGLDPNADQ